MSFDFRTFNSKLQKQLGDIGYKNGTAPPNSQDPIDSHLHVYYVSKMMEKVGKSGADESFKSTLYHGGELVKQTIDQLLADTLKFDVGQSGVVTKGQFYQLNLTTKKPSQRMNETKLRTLLMTKHGLSVSDVEELMSEAKEGGNPTKMFTVQPV